MVQTYQKLQFKLYLKPFFFFAILKSLVGISFYCRFIVMPLPSIARQFRHLFPYMQQTPNLEC